MKGQRYIWIERRLYPSLRMEVLAAILSILLALLAIGVLFGVVGVDPLFVYRRIFMGAFGSLFGLSETIVKAIPLMLVGVGLTLAFRARMWNIGAEGQLLMGAIAATGVALTFPDLPAGVLLPAMFVAGFVGGALWGLIPALLKVYFRANEVLTSLMLVYVASEAVNYLVYGPWRGPEEMGFPLTSKFSPAAQLPRLLNTRIHYLTLLLALLLAVLVYLLVRRTRLGYEIRVTGENPTAARYAGMDYTKIVLLVMLLSGGLA
ncbi:ABC transporter permease, partial [Candidatus Hakubella thermalkaliphila]